MEKLYELHEERDFDLIVVDTPPTRNALDFLEAPRRLTRFLDHRLYRMLMAPTRGIVKAVNVAAQAFLRTVSKVVGGEVVRDAITFFQAFDGMEQGFQDRAEHVLELLSARRPPRSCSSPRRAATSSTRRPSSPTKLAEADIPVRALDRQPHAPAVQRRVARRDAPSGPRRFAGTDLGGLYANLADFLARRANEEDAPRRARRRGRARTRWSGCRSSQTDVHDLDGLAEIAAHLFAAPRSLEFGAARPTVVESSARSRSAVDRFVDRLGDRDDAIEAGGVQQAGEGGTAARHRHLALGLAGPADAADERAEAGRVHERHLGEVDQEPRRRRPARPAPHGTGRRCRRRARRPDGTGCTRRCPRRGSRARGPPAWSGRGVADGRRPSAPTATPCSCGGRRTWLSSRRRRRRRRRAGSLTCDGPALASAPWPTVLLATDADWIFDEVDAALAEPTTPWCTGSAAASTCSRPSIELEPDLVDPRPADRQHGRHGHLHGDPPRGGRRAASPITAVLMLLDRARRRVPRPARRRRRLADQAARRLPPAPGRQALLDGLHSYEGVDDRTDLPTASPPVDTGEEHLDGAVEDRAGEAAAS